VHISLHNGSFVKSFSGEAAEMQTFGELSLLFLTPRSRHGRAWPEWATTRVYPASRKTLAGVRWRSESNLSGTQF
jgi:hypothetical protein